jgi:O-antigen biosynthesis protein WbqV
MGNPIRIEDLAREMIRLSDPSGTSDIQIEYSGLRPGEKMEEELFAVDEEPTPTAWDFLLLARNRRSEPDVLARSIRLEEMATARDEAGLRAKLMGWE